jgi:hypothetical protein
LIESHRSVESEANESRFPETEPDCVLDQFASDSEITKVMLDFKRSRAAEAKRITLSRIKHVVEAIRR